MQCPNICIYFLNTAQATPLFLSAAVIMHYVSRVNVLHSILLLMYRTWIYAKLFYFIMEIRKKIIFIFKMQNRKSVFFCNNWLSIWIMGIFCERNTCAWCHSRRHATTKMLYEREIGVRADVGGGGGGAIPLKLKWKASSHSIVIQNHGFCFCFWLRSHNINCNSFGMLWWNFAEKISVCQSSRAKLSQ